MVVVSMYWITHREAKKIIKAENKIFLNLDLEKTQKKFDVL